MGGTAVLLRATLPRAPLFWLGVRLLLFVVERFGGDALSGQAAAHPLAGRGPLFSGMAALLVALLVIIDTRALREDVLLANLGIGARHLAASAFAAALALEIACALLFP
jgi:hypothetical protein